MSSEFDWLEGPLHEDTKELGWLFNDDKPVSEKSVVLQDPRFVNLARDTRRLSFRKRLFLKCFVSSGGSVPKAFKKLSAALGVKLDVSNIYRWMRDPEYRRIVERYVELATEVAGLNNPARTFLRINAVVEDALEPVPRIVNGEHVRDANGELQYEVDRSNALKGLEMIGKGQGAFRKDEQESARVTVFLDFSGERQQGETDREDDVLEGDFTEVAPK